MAAGCCCCCSCCCCRSAYTESPGIRDSEYATQYLRSAEQKGSWLDEHVTNPRLRGCIEGVKMGMKMVRTGSMKHFFCLICFTYLRPLLCFSSLLAFQLGSLLCPSASTLVGASWLFSWALSVVLLHLSVSRRRSSNSFSKCSFAFFTSPSSLFGFPSAFDIFRLFIYAAYSRVCLSHRNILSPCSSVLARAAFLHIVQKYLFCLRACIYSVPCFLSSSWPVFCRLPGGSLFCGFYH